jgi:hypothetical protein
VSQSGYYNLRESDRSNLVSAELCANDAHTYIHEFALEPGQCCLRFGSIRDVVCGAAGWQELFRSFPRSATASVRTTKLASRVPQKGRGQVKGFCWHGSQQIEG